MTKKQDFFGEVVESSLQEWVTQSWNWDKFPEFGSIVTVKNGEIAIFGIVYQIKTGSIDSNRQAFAYQKTEEELIREQPQIFELLKTNFSCLVLGYEENDCFFSMLASKPPKIHSFVRQASLKEIQNIFKTTQYLQLIFNSAGIISNLDELLIVLIKNLTILNVIDKNNFEEFIQSFALLTRNDYFRLKLFMHRIGPILQLNNF